MLALAAVSFSSSSLIGLMIWVAIAAVVCWAIISLVRWSGVQIPQPVMIIFWAFVAIGLILLIAKAFGMMV